jgi:hypothetical protein
MTTPASAPRTEDDRTDLGNQAMRSLVALGLCVVVALAGCSRRTGLAVEFVEGQVTLDGQPLADALVGFSPTARPGYSASGRTDTRGLYRLTTSRGGGPLRGAPVGEYVVTVRKYRNQMESLGPEPDPSEATAHATWKAEFERLSTMSLQSLIPEGYGDQATSGLRATVKRGRNTGPEVSFTLKSDFQPDKKRP